MARTDPQINLRIPVDLKSKVEEAAVDSGRSTNAEILWRLEGSLATETGPARLLEQRIREFEALIFRMVDFQQALAVAELARTKSKNDKSKMEKWDQEVKLLLIRKKQLQADAQRLQADLSHYLNSLSTHASELEGLFEKASTQLSHEKR